MPPIAPIRIEARSSGNLRTGSPPAPSAPVPQARPPAAVRGHLLALPPRLQVALRSFPDIFRRVRRDCGEIATDHTCRAGAPAHRTALHLEADREVRLQLVELEARFQCVDVKEIVPAIIGAGWAVAVGHINHLQLEVGLPLHAREKGAPVLDQRRIAGIGARQAGSRTTSIGAR